jgi:hypothetical protein
MTRWKKGQSGNPLGRAPSLQHKEFFEKVIKPHKSELLELAIKKAKTGKHPQILKFLLERFIPKVAADPLEYEKMLLEIDKLRKEIKLLDEAPTLLELIKEDPKIKERLKEKGLNNEEQIC